MRVMVIGSGAREHCLIWKISKSRDVDKIYAIPGNAGISKIAECVELNIGKDGFRDLAELAEDKKIDLTVVGPEAPLVDGVVDFFNQRDLKIFGPNQNASMLEGSKVFTKKLLQKYDIPTPSGVIFRKEEYEDALTYLENISNKSFPIVVKADGLAAGKGVVIATDKSQAIEAIKDCFIRGKFGSSGDKIIIEEFLKGFEVSLLCLCDGKTVLPLALAQDYKRIYEGDRGKNTGGMGSYSPVPLVSKDIYEKILDEIIYPTYQALIKEGISYKGILYGGLLISDGKPYLLEYNCRFGDPETQAILPRLEDDLVTLLLDCVDGGLNQRRINWDSQKCICVVLASKNYPESSSSGEVIKGLDMFEGQDEILIFHAGTRKENGNIVTNGGRILSVVSKATNFKEARTKVYSAINYINFDGMQFRRDIALKVEERS